ncbi:unnamed protein product [marine sediment metagenome]|uniref:Uncharacterized protein n=1 Tax=marine sediment metagenome TaxID=412755 RepID=X1C0Q2_9ZZZZ
MSEKKTCKSCKLYDSGLCFVEDLDKDPYIIAEEDFICEKWEKG